MYQLGLTSIENFLKLDEEHSMQANRKLIDTEKTILLDIGESYPKVQLTFADDVY